MCLAKRVLHPTFFTVLPLFFEKQQLPCQGQGLVYYRDWGQRGHERNLLHKAFMYPADLSSLELSENIASNLYVS